MAKAAKQKDRADYHTKRTQDHAVIRDWAEERGGRPAMVKGTQILRIDFDDPDQKLAPVPWDEFFRVFDERGLEFLYQEHTHDGSSAASISLSKPVARTKTLKPGPTGE